MKNVMKNSVRICGFLQIYNEVEKGNLTRCLENMKQWADDIVIYDDASTDNSVEVASQYTDHIILGEKNNFQNELSSKQLLLDLALTLSPDWIMWMDCDEILDRNGTNGSLRALAESADKKVDAFSFRELNLWRSETYARTDSHFDKGWFCRLWRVVPAVKFRVVSGVHQRLHPINILPSKTSKSNIRVIHYGHAHYEQSLVRQGYAYGSDAEFQRAAKKSWIFNEEKCKCYRVPDEVFPEENVPQDLWPEPKPREIESLTSYTDSEYKEFKQYDQVVQKVRSKALPTFAYNSPMECSIVLTTFDKPESLDAVLASIYSQSPMFRWEVILINDGPSLETISICEDYASRFSNFSYFISGNKKYRNPAAARNIGLREAKGRVILSQCDDVVHISDNVISNLVEQLQPGKFLLSKTENWEYANRKPRRYVEDYCSKDKRQAPFFFCGSALRSDIYAVGGNDEEFVHPSYDDTWLADCLMKGQGLEPEYSETILTHHIRHSRIHGSHAKEKDSRALYREKVKLARSTGVWQATGGPWEYELQ